MRRYIHRYTLTEILVAVAVLMLMMTFLMQFVIGSQRIWYASSRTSSLFDKAQIVFSVMETDLKQSLFSNEKGESMPMYLNSPKDESYSVGSHYTSVKLGLIAPIISKDVKEGFSVSDFAPSTPPLESSDLDNAGHIVNSTYFPVLYHFDRDNYKLYRLALDTVRYEVNNNNKLTFQNINEYYYGKNYSENVPDSDNIYEQAATFFDEQIKEVLADDLLDFSIEMFPNANIGGFLNERPKAVRVTLMLFDHEKYPDYKLRGNISSSEDKLKQENDILKDARTFSKVIFLQ